jgi:hypothetical protein
MVNTLVSIRHILPIESDIFAFELRYLRSDDQINYYNFNAL